MHLHAPSRSMLLGLSLSAGLFTGPCIDDLHSEHAACPSPLLSCFPLQAHYRDHAQMTYARSMLVIHNMAHQGRGPLAELSNFEIPGQYAEHFRLYDPIGGEHMNIMKAGLINAHRIVAVSHG